MLRLRLFRHLAFIVFSFLGGSWPATAAIVEFGSAGIVTSEVGAITFEDFDGGTLHGLDTSIATVVGGAVNGGSNPGGGGNWRSSQFGAEIFVNFTAPADYFGFLWATADPDNRVRFYREDVLLQEVFCGPACRTTTFANYEASDPDDHFDRVTLFFQGLSFETDNYAGRLSVVPLPAAVWLFGTALLGLMGFNKIRKRAT